MNRYFIVAAPRSGTKILRDTLDAHPALTTTVKPREDIWTYGQDDRDHESYPPSSLTSDIKQHVRESFNNLIPENTTHFIEKNVRNSLRIPYIKEIFPNAKFIHIIRDGRDEVASNVEHKKSPIDWKYYLSSQAFNISPTDIIKFSMKLGTKLLKRILYPGQDVAIWGPRFKGFGDVVDTKDPLEISALQWKHCVGEAHRSGLKLSDKDYFEIKYEALMNKPVPILQNLADFCGVESPDPMIDFATPNYRTDSIGRWQNDLNNKQLKIVESIIGDLLTKFSYRLSNQKKS